MHRCLELAALANNSVAPNPMVGAVLVHENRIIGEGYHEQYGKAHAEVNCINSVKSGDLQLIDQSTLYVSLEPCAHHGKTPPCADLIIAKKIPRVVIGCRDPFGEVDGKGIEKLKKANVEVELGILERECKELNKRFFTFHTKHRPFVVLKWAQTADKKIASPGHEEKGNGSSGSVHGKLPSVGAGQEKARLLISNEYSNRLVHKWRSEEMAIMVGKNTAMRDDPELTTRLWPGKNPLRLVVDLDLELPKTLRVFNANAPTIVFNLHEHSLPEKINVNDLKGVGTAYYQVTNDVTLVHQAMNALYQLGVQSVLVEGGAYLLQSFIDEGIWDEARIITNTALTINEGLPAPGLKHHELINSEQFLADTILTYKKNDTN